jgi:voltage-gated potassium channel
MEDVKNKILEQWKSKTAMYDLGGKYLSYPISVIFLLLARAISPTWWWASKQKEGLNEADRKKGIIARNYCYLFVSSFLCVMLLFIFDLAKYESISLTSKILVYVYLYLVTWSRCNEVFFAFINDALDKSENKKSSSNLTYRKRIELSFLSYFELILNYAIIYLLIPSEHIKGEINTIIDSIYFSGITMTTLGYGDLSPITWIVKLLTVHQVLVGFTLIIVSFAVYVGHGLSDKGT